MAHLAQIEYCNNIKSKFPQYFDNVKVLDCGSADINGNNRYLFTNSEYIGIDVAEAPNVDYVGTISNYYLDFIVNRESMFDTIISTECFEHDPYFDSSLLSIIGMLKKGGMFLMTCATTGREEHGTIKNDPASSLTAQIGIEHYKNITEDDFHAVFDKYLCGIDEIFSEYEFDILGTDLRFFGIKR